MRDIAQIRRENFRSLVHQKGGQTAVAEALGKEKSQINQWFIDPGPKHARSIGTRSARAIEQALGKPDGWLDSPRPDDTPVQERDEGRSPSVRLTLAILHQAHTWLDILETTEGVKYDLDTRMVRLLELLLMLDEDGGRLTVEHHQAVIDAAVKRRAEREGSWQEVSHQEAARS